MFFFLNLIHRVLELEKMKEDVDLQLRTKDVQDTKLDEDIDGGSSDSDNDTDDIDEFLDWRSKKAYK